MVTSKFRGCFKWILLAGLVLGLGAYLVAESLFNVDSNLVALSVRNASTPLKVRLKHGAWSAPAEVTPPEMQNALIERHAEPGLKWQSLRVVRDNGLLAKAAQGIFGAEVHVITISPDLFEFTMSFRPKFEVTTAKERMDSEGSWFIINANFHEPNGKPLGWVTHESQQVHGPFPEWSGTFFVKNGRPYCGPKSLLDEIPGPVEEGCQVYPSVMKNHTVFPYVELQPNRFFDGKRITYRGLAGMKRDGTIVFIASGDGGLMTVMEVAEIARKLDVQHATLLDGGRALQYSVRTADGPWHFHASNTQVETSWEALQKQQSPVFIAVRRRAPRIITGPAPSPNP
jgi:hypothetical protein